MGFLSTNNFGTLSYDPATALEFPHGLPGFEERKRFLALHFEDTDPLLFLQSIDDAGLCFVTLPVLAVNRQYRLRVEVADRELIGLAQDELRIGRDVLCLAVLSLKEDGPTANLLAPVVINLRNRLAVQAVAPESGYSHQEPLAVEEAPTCL